MVGVTFEQVRRTALELPGAEELLTWGTETAFQVSGKMFAVGAAESSYATVKASPAEQASLVAGDPDTFTVAPTTGIFGWVRVDLAQVQPDTMRLLIVSAWRTAAPRRLAAGFEQS